MTVHALNGGREMASTEQLYVWRVATRYPDRKGTLCRVLVRGKMNSCLVEFVNDGYRTITSRNYVRKAQ